jgi:hypothetical protein
MNADTDSTVRQIEFELEKAEHGLAMPYDAERVGQLRKMLVEARKRKLSAGLAARRGTGASSTTRARRSGRSARRLRRPRQRKTDSTDCWCRS